MEQAQVHILEKVKKLLALSTSSNPNEAAAAAAKAQALLAQYNLDISQVETETKSKPAPYIKQSVDVGSNRVWKRNLIAVIARANFCEIVYRSRSSSVSVIGQTHNIEVVHYLYNYLAGQLEHMAESAYRQSGRYEAAVSYKDSFYMGAISSLHQRLQTQQRQFTQSSSTCRSLVVVKDAELQEAVKTFYPNLRKSRQQKSVRNSDAYYRGIEAGRKVSLYQGVNAPSGLKQLRSFNP